MGIMCVAHLHLRKLWHEAPGDPGRVQESLPVGLVIHVVAILLLPGQRPAEELLRHLRGEVVLAMRIGSAREIA